MGRLIPLLILATAAFAAEPKVVYLYPNGAPGSEGKTGDETVQVQPSGERVFHNIHKPSILVYLPSKETATGAAVVIAPGGGHNSLWAEHEGFNVGTWLSEHGIAGFVVKYRLAREQGSTYTVEGDAFGDMQQAIKVVRAHAEEWGVRPDRVGVMGFSAGGELAALAGFRYDDSTKPAFQALIYPAIPKDMAAKLTKETPPAFMACGENDRQNISQGLPELYLAFKKAGANAELHVYGGVGHGFGLRPANKGATAEWIVRFREWMDARGMLKK